MQYAHAMHTSKSSAEICELEEKLKGLLQRLAAIVIACPELEPEISPRIFALIEPVTGCPHCEAEAQARP